MGRAASRSSAATDGHWRGERAGSASSARELGIGRRQQPRQTLGPASLTIGIGNQILTDLDFDMRQTAALAMHRDGVVRQVADPVGLVLADNKIAFGPQQFRQWMRQACITIEEYCHMPRP